VEALPEVAERIHVGHRGTTLEMLCGHVSGIRMTMLDICKNGISAATMQKSGVEGHQTIAMAVLADAPGALSRQDEFCADTNIVILAFILEKQTSKSIRHLLKTEIIDPLEMYRTGIYSDGKGDVGSPRKPTQPWGHTISTRIKQMKAADPCELTNGLPAAFHFTNFFLHRCQI
jgi:CubicO group peptidase (beta-lactamase class C family)